MLFDWNWIKQTKIAFWATLWGTYG